MAEIDLFDTAISNLKQNKSTTSNTNIFGIEKPSPIIPVSSSEDGGDLFDNAINKLKTGESKEKADQRSTLEYTGAILKDLVLQPAGGVVDASESIINLALPKESEIEISDIIPEPETGFGRFVRPGSQFFIPYTGAFKILKGGSLYLRNQSKLKKVLQNAKKDQKLPLDERINVRTSNTFQFSPTTTLSRKELAGLSVGAGAVSDAFAFAPTDPNLADLFVQFPATKFAVFEWLSTDPDGDPSMERLKNTLAGLVPSFFIPEITRGVAKGFNFVSQPAVKKVNKYAEKRIAKETDEIAQELDKAKKQKKSVKIEDLEQQVRGRRTGTEKVAIAFKEGQLLKKTIINFLDNVRGIKYLEDAAKTFNVKGLKGLTKNTKEISAYQEARFLPAVGGMVEHFLLKQTFRFKDGVFESTGQDGLQGLLIKNLGKDADIDDFFNYVGAKSLESLKKSDKKLYIGLLDTPSKQNFWNNIAKQGEAKAGYQATLKELDRFNKDLLQVAVDAQLISPKTMASLIKKRKPYMPLYRDFSSESLVAAKGGGGNKFLQLKAKVPVGTEKGELPFRNFFDNYIENVNGIISSSYKNHVKRGVFDIIDMAKKQGIDNLDSWAKKAKNVRAKKLTIKSDEIKEKISKQDTDIDLNAIDDLDDLTLFRSERVSVGKDQEFVLRTNEKGQTVRDVYDIENPLLYSTLTSISPKQFYGTNAFVRFARFWKNLLTKAVTYDPGFFAGANFIRDTISASILSRNAFHLPFLSTAMRYRNKVFSNKPIKLKDGTITTYNKLSQEFFLNGGSFASTLLKGDLQEQSLKRIYRQMGHSDYQNVLNTPRKFLDGYENVVTGFENASRFTEFVLLRKAGRSARQAAFEAREVAVDFGMQGAWNFWRQYVSTVPFLNAGLQGLFRTARALTPGSEQVASTVAKITAFAGTPTLLFYYMNKDNPDYYKQSQQVRDLNFMIPLGEGNWLKIPKPFEFGAISTIAENFLDTLYKTGNADKFFDTAWTVLKAQTRLSVVPQVLSPIVNSAFNKTYFGSPIIPEGMRHSIPDYGQSYPWSNKVITSAIENAPPWLRNKLMSPIEFENLFRAYTGTIGTYFLDLLDTSSELFTDVELKDWRADEYPILKRFLTLDPAKYTSYEQRFYELKKQASQAYNQAKKFKDEFKFELLNEFYNQKENQELISLYPQLERWSRMISDLNRKRNRIQNLPDMSGQRKKVLIDEIEKETSLIFDAIMSDLENRNLTIFEPMIKFTPINEQ